MRAGKFSGALLGGRYRLGERLGGGGMGDVYLAEHVETGRRFALKILNEVYGARTDAIERFRREAQAASRIEHEHIISVTDFGYEPDGPYYLVMELLRGESLDVTLRQCGPLPWTVVRRIALQLCDALQAVHDVGIVHRDLKPANCFRTRIGDEQFFIKILDFGIAKLRLDTRDGAGESLTGTGTLLGTLPYMAPEQADDSAHVDHRADIYSLGVIVYQLLTGQLPIRGQSDVQVLYNLLHRTPAPLCEAAPDLTFSAGLERVVQRALAKRADDRYPDMRAFAAALRAIEGERTSPEPVPSGESARTVEPFALEATLAAATSAPREGSGRDRVEFPTVTPPPTVSSPARPRAGLRLPFLFGSIAVGGAVAWAGVQLLGEPSPETEVHADLAERSVDAPDPSARGSTPPEVGAEATRGEESAQEAPKPAAAAEPSRSPERAATPPPPPEPPVPVTNSGRARNPRPSKTGTSAAGTPTPTPAQPSPEQRMTQAKDQTIRRIADIVRQHASRATSARIRIGVTFDGSTGRPKAIDLGGNLEHTTFGQRVQEDIKKVQIPNVLPRDLEIHEWFDIPQDG